MPVKLKKILILFLCLLLLAPMIGVIDQSYAESYRYYGSINSDVYHYPSCYYVDRIKSYNLTGFTSAADAQRYGYRPCKVCRPPWSDGGSSSSSSGYTHSETAEMYYLLNYNYGQVKELKEWLFQLGYYNGALDDYSNTDLMIAGVKAYQKAHGLTVNGKADTATRTAIYNEFIESKNVVRASVVGFNVYINGRLVNNTNADYPFVTYKNMTYMPMTSDILMGVGGFLTDSGSSLNIGTAEYYYSLQQAFLSSNHKAGQALKMNIEWRPLYIKGYAYLDGGNYPILNYNNIVYVPLSGYVITYAFPFSARWIDGDGLYLINN